MLMFKLLVRNRQVEVKSLRDIHLRIDRDKGEIRVRVIDIEADHGMIELITPNRIRIGELAGDIFSVSMYLGAVYPDIHLGNTPSVLISAISRYGPSNIWIQYKFIFYGEKLT